MAIIQNGRFVRATTARPWRAFGGGGALVIAAGVAPQNEQRRSAAYSAPRKPFRVKSYLAARTDSAEFYLRCVQLTASAPCHPGTFPLRFGFGFSFDRMAVLCKKRVPILGTLFAFSLT